MHEVDIIRGIFARYADRQMADEPRFVDVSESPIERIMAWSFKLNVLYGHCNFRHHASFETLEDELALLPHMRRAYCSVSSQAPVGQYRCDFIVSRLMGFEEAAPIRIVVECDGHDFHEKTKEQAARDKERERFLVGMGCHVMRFTGSEIWRMPDECAGSVYRTVERLSIRAAAGRRVVNADGIPF